MSEALLDTPLSAEQRDAAHSLRGSIFVQGGQGLAEACTDLEKACRQERTAAAESLVARVEAEFDKLRRTTEPPPARRNGVSAAVKHTQAAD